MTNHSSNKTVIQNNRTSTLNDIELDAAVGGSFLSAVKEAVLHGAGYIPCCGGVRR